MAAGVNDISVTDRRLLMDNINSTGIIMARRRIDVAVSNVA